MRRSAALLVLCCLLATPASADEMTWDYASLVARDYWQERSVVLPCQPTPQVLSPAADDELQAAYGAPIDMLADPQTCRVLVTYGIDWYRTNGGGSDYCQGVVHEFGHLAGLDHNSISDRTPFACAHPRQWKVAQGWRKPPRWVRRSPHRVQRLWQDGRVWRAQVARARWLKRR